MMPAFTPVSSMPLLDLLDEQGGNLVHGRAPEDAGHGQVIAGAGDGMDAGAATDVLHHGYVAAQVQGGHVDDGAHAAVVGFRERLGCGVGDGVKVLESRIGGGGASSAQGDVLVAEGEAEIGGIDGAENGVDLRHGGSLRSIFTWTFRKNRTVDPRR